jgi:L-threonylcarbamoyladenylate synthase
VIDAGAELERAVTVLKNGGLVGLPTETVYGLAADATNDAAVRRIFTVKGRPADHPLIVHVANVEGTSYWCDQLPTTAQKLADSCWPGPLTLIVPRSVRVLDVVTGGRDCVGLRVPAHPMAQLVLQHFIGLAAPSANRFGRVSPTTPAHVRSDLGDDVDFVLDGGPCPIGVESTIVDCTGEVPQILRPGGIGNEQIEALLEGIVAEPTGQARASGMLASHYSPRCRVHLATSLADATAQAKQLSAAGYATDVLDPSQDLVSAAQNLYSQLRECDARKLDDLVAVLPAPFGLGHAIRDRLRKAAGLG